jgi:putative flippase GtrA
MTQLRWMLRQFLNRQFGVFLVVGGIAAFANWLSRFWFSDHMGFAAAVAFAYLVGVITAFILNCLFVFPGSDRSLVHRMSYFAGTNLLMFPVVWVVSVTLRRFFFPALGLTSHVEEISHGIGLAAPVLLSFLIHKFFTFGKLDSAPPNADERKGE